MQLFVIAVGFLLVAVVQEAFSSPAPTQVIEERAACNQDNLLRALQSASHLSDSYQFCSAYISVPPTSTVTVYTSTSVLSTYAFATKTVHPLYLYNLQGNGRYPPYTGPPLSYNSASPTPSPVPGNPQYYDWPSGVPIPQKRALSELQRRAGTTVPSYIATTYPASRLSSACSCLSVPAASTTTISTYFYSQETTSTCTIYTPTSTATYPAFCAPSLQVNAASPNSHAGYRAVPNFPVASKMDCCATCAGIFNCVWWKFDFGTPGDGWKPGICHYAYYIGTSTDAGLEYNQPAICPNGVTQGITNGITGQIGLEANNDHPGYNSGPCGNAYNNFESSQDFGYPDDYYLHTCPYP